MSNEQIAFAKQTLDDFLKENNVYDDYYNLDDGSNRPFKDSTLESAIALCGFSWWNDQSKLSPEAWNNLSLKWRGICIEKEIYNIPLLKVLNYTKKLSSIKILKLFLEKHDVYEEFKEFYGSGGARVAVRPTMDVFHGIHWISWNISVKKIRAVKLHNEWVKLCRNLKLDCNEIIDFSKV